MHCSQKSTLKAKLLTCGLLALVDLGIWAHQEEDGKENGELEIASSLLKRIRSLLVLYREHPAGVKRASLCPSPPIKFLLCLKVYVTV